MLYTEDVKVSIDDYSAIKSICSFIRKSDSIEDNVTRDSIKDKFLYLHKYYIEIYNNDNPTVVFAWPVLIVR